LADISGYTSFVAQTEVDHSWSILHELLDTMVRSVEGRLDVSQVEGDAILFISGLSTIEVIAALEQTFVAFHRRLRDMQAVTTCQLGAAEGGDEDIAYFWRRARAGERERCLPEDAANHGEGFGQSPRSNIFARMLEPKVMERYLFADAVDVVHSARGEALDGK